MYRLVGDITKFTDQIVGVLLIISILFIFSFFMGNYTGTAIGLVMFGSALSLKMFDMEVKSRAMIYMWVAIIVMISVLLGTEYLLPKISINP